MSLRVGLLLVLALLVSGASAYFLFFKAATVSKSQSDTIVVKVPEQPVDTIPTPGDYQNAVVIRSTDVAISMNGEETVIPFDSVDASLPARFAAYSEPALNVILEKGGDREQARKILSSLGKSGISKFQWFNLN